MPEAVIEGVHDSDGGIADDALTVGQFLDEVPEKNIQLSKSVCTGWVEELERISTFRCELLLCLDGKILHRIGRFPTGYCRMLGSNIPAFSLPNEPVCRFVPPPSGYLPEIFFANHLGTFLLKKNKNTSTGLAPRYENEPFT
ncbi:uncharacterized protein LOC129760285 [Uranotaenia lowii]|uniref:uncharacterized protein LOC129760285 n=1 Tax=Uranotaenia lowii TaxID=190385 RepID=UPI00247A4CE4|nr:uncharacterized protein LOC129760285 [Uranotaenia lowii]